MGNAYAKNGELDLAVTRYNKALKFGLEFAQTHANLGMVYEMKGKLNKAMVEYQRALKINPDFSEIRKCLQDLEVLRGDKIKYAQ